MYIGIRNTSCSRRCQHSNFNAFLNIHHDYYYHSTSVTGEGGVSLTVYTYKNNNVKLLFTTLHFFRSTYKQILYNVYSKKILISVFFSHSLTLPSQVGFLIKYYYLLYLCVPI